ncbi:hypothetical protein MYK68_18625 [Gordonia sp. PP30]|uniref:hypothetical protein n=1 Tax=Gordonia sp. PP30 TaxID=2935861 RepID=UPI001FFF800F|nr:hypothetical protein [Gordonia sp. PP30]UQE74700.1 hypothetical protein MYK68_18625 [Gordonia sp. PP30]
MADVVDLDAPALTYDRTREADPDGTPVNVYICDECAAEIRVRLDSDPVIDWKLSLGKVHRALDEHADVCPGPPLPAELATWRELCDVDAEVHHDGDAEILTGCKRPSWAAPERDVITHSPWFGGFRSTPAVLPLARRRADDAGAAYMDRAHLLVAAKQYPLQGTAGLTVGLTVGKEWLTMFTAEARQLARLLHAAADLAESETSARHD